MKPEYLIAARDQFKSAQNSLVMAARALQLTGMDLTLMLKEIKENIGDLAITVEILNDHIDNLRKT